MSSSETQSSSREVVQSTAPVSQGNRDVTQGNANAPMHVLPLASLGAKAVDKDGQHAVGHRAKATTDIETPDQSHQVLPKTGEGQQYLFQGIGLLGLTASLAMSKKRGYDEKLKQ